MLDEIKMLYVELESIDLSLLLHMQNKALKELSRSLKARERQLQKIGLLLEQLPEMKMADEEHDILLGLQDHAMNRNQRIVHLMTNLCNVAKEEFLKCQPGRSKISPYMRKTGQSGRVKA